MDEETRDIRGPAIVVLGDVLKGFTFVGPFTSVDSALSWWNEHTLEGKIGMSALITLLKEPEGE